MSLHGKSLIAGKPGKTGGKTFRAYNPATGRSIDPEFHQAHPAEADEAMALAAAAGEDYGRRPHEARAVFLETIAKEIEALGDTLIQRGHEETALPLARLQGERARTCAQLRLFAEVVREGSWVDARIDTALPDRQPLPRPDLRRILIPLGPVVVFGSSNFPLAFSVAGGDTASAFAAGCPVVVKAHSSHPGTAELVGEAIVRAVALCGLPAGVFSLIHGSGATVGTAMVRHPAAAAVGFTGSSAAGRALFDAAASRPHPIPVFAEMSSLNPVFLLPGILGQKATAVAQGLLASFTLGVGQFCTKPGLVFAVRGPETDSFLHALSAAVKAAPCASMLSTGIHEAFLTNEGKIRGLPGVRVFAEASGEPARAKTEARPTVAVAAAADFLKTPEMATEAFGPFTLVILADSFVELASCAAAVEGQLTATVHGTPADLEGAGALLAQLERKVGRLLINGFPTGVEVCPAMNHGGPYPATTDARFTSVGTAAIYRFSRPICYQNFPENLLPDPLRNKNPLKIMRLVNGQRTREAV